MLVCTVHHIGSRCVSYNVKLFGIEKLVAALNLILRELQHHIQSARPVEGNTSHILEVEVHMTIINT